MTNLLPGQTNNDDLWELDSGLREGVMTVVSASFSFTAGYNNGNTMLLTLIGYDEAGEEMSAKYSCGGDWDTPDGGRTITHPSKSKINKNSAYGHFLDYAMKLPELLALLKQRGTPRTAAIWHTLILDLENVEFSYGKNKTGEQIPSSVRLMPVAFKGVASGNGPAPAPAQNIPQMQTVPQVVQPIASVPATIVQQPLTPLSVPANVSPADAVAAARAAQVQPQPVQSPVVATPAVSVTPVGSPLFMKAWQLALTADSHAAFMTKAFQDAEILADDELATQVADPNGPFAPAIAMTT